MEENRIVLDTPVAPLPNPGEGGPVYDDEAQLPSVPLPNPGEGAAGAIGIALKKDFGYGKNVLDLGCVALSIAITLIFSGRISNIGIGTVLSMLVTGRIVKLFSAPTGKLYEKVS